MGDAVDSKSPVPKQARDRIGAVLGSEYSTRKMFFELMKAAMMDAIVKTSNQEKEGLTMSFLSIASGASVWRGYEYFTEKKVRSLTKKSDTQFAAFVKGTGSAPYSVLIDIEHPRKSVCTCPHASGRRIICKHMVATYFTAFPEEAKRFYDEAVAYEEEEERRQEEREDKLIAFIGKCKKQELQQMLLQLLFDGPEWQYERFLEEHWIE